MKKQYQRRKRFEHAAIFASAMASTRAMARVDCGYLDVVLAALGLNLFHPACILAYRYMKFDGDGIERWAQAHARIMNDEPEVGF